MRLQTLRGLLHPVGFLIAMASVMLAFPISAGALVLSQWSMVQRWDPFILTFLIAITLGVGGFFLWCGLDLSRMALRRAIRDHGRDAEAPAVSRVPLIATEVIVLAAMLGFLSISSVLDNLLHTYGLPLIVQGVASAIIAVLMTVVISVFIASQYGLREQDQ